MNRTLDLWTGVQTSKYKIDGQDITVETCVHPKLDMVAVRIESPLVESGDLEVALNFAYPALQKSPWYPAWVGDFGRKDRHTTTKIKESSTRIDLKRTVDSTVYHVSLAAAEGCVLHNPDSEQPAKKIEIKSAEFGLPDKKIDVTAKVASVIKDNGISLPVPNPILGNVMGGGVKTLKVVYSLDGQEEIAEIPENQTLYIPGLAHRAYKVSGRGAKVLAFICAFSAEPIPAQLPTFEETRSASVAHWEDYWKHGGAIDLSASKDPRWKELERRIVLSQYHMAAQSAGSWPSAEMGLLGIDGWSSHFHMEMVWWHIAHYALWDRWELGDKALGCYQRFIPTARELAIQLGKKGLQWGKSCGPEGRSSPWYGNHPLLWKQPHPIFFAELEYRLKPTRATLEKWAEIVNGTAEYMADYPKRDAINGIYSLDPAMPPSEQGITKNDVFDLAYWRWGLDKAQEWRERMGLKREPHWDNVRKNLMPLPVVDGLFVHSTEWHDTYTKRNYEHPDPIGVFGMLPLIDGVDRKTAHRTVKKVWETWKWDQTWGWDMPWLAMAAARVGEPLLAVEALLKNSGRNHFDTIGINTGGPCPYLPGNGGLLYAIAMMTAGWDGSPNRNAPGFPDDGSWVVKWEGLKKAP